MKCIVFIHIFVFFRFGAVLVSCYSVFLLLPSVVSFSRRRILMVIETIHNFSIRPFTKNIDISIDNRVDPNSIGSVKLKWYTYTQQPNTICRGLASLHSITQHRKFISYFDSECYKFYKMICDKRARSRERGEQLFFFSVFGYVSPTPYWRNKNTNYSTSFIRSRSKSKQLISCTACGFNTYKHVSLQRIAFVCFVSTVTVHVVCAVCFF